MAQEGKFLKSGVAYDAATGLTYDGQPIDPTTLLLSSNARNWSSPSKEALFNHLMALALTNNTLAQYIFAVNSPTNVTNTVFDLLAKRIAAYQSFNTSNPGYGGFLTWFTISGGKITPTGDWRVCLNNFH